MFVRTTCFGRQGVRVRLDFLREPESRFLESPPTLGGILQIECDPLGIQPGRKIAQAGHRQVTPDDHAVEALQNPVDFLPVFGNKRLHGIAPSWLQTHTCSGWTMPFYSYLWLRRSCCRNRCSSRASYHCRSSAGGW